MNANNDFLKKIGSDQPFKIVESHVYAKIGGNDSLLPSPAVVHFGGYSLNEVHVQKISVLNTSSVSQRLHVVNTTTPFFRVKYEKKGRVAPGMSEDLYIEFKPNAWRYYYDCVRIHCEDENLLIPIHAYPVINDVVFPRVLDFGASSLCDTTTKVVDIKCNVPIQFEYEIIITKPHPDFNITPLRGLIPANGAARVSVTYSPVKLGTASMEMQIDVSQFNFEPITCHISGNAAPGIVRNRILAQINEAANNRATAEKRDNNNSSSSSSSNEDHTATSVPEVQDAIDETLKLSRRKFAEGLPLETYDRSLEIPWHGIGSGAPLDAGGAYLASKERTAYRTRTQARLRKESQTTMSTDLLGGERVEEEGIDVVNGLRVPRDLTNMTAVNYLLTQELGKLKPGDLKQAIAQQRAARERRRLEQNALKTGDADQSGSADSVIADELAALKAGSGKRQLKEMVFLQGLREIGESEVNREFQSQRQHVGSPLLHNNDIERIQMTRTEARKARNLITRSEDRQRYQTLSQAARLEGKARGRATCLSFTLSVPSYRPTYDIYQNDLWSMRRHALQKFQNAGNTVVIRLRCGQRLALIKRFLRQALGENMTRAQVKVLVERDNRLAAAGVILSQQLNEQNESEQAGGANGGGHGESSENDASGGLANPAMDLPCMPEVSGGGGGGGGGGGSDSNRAPVDVAVPTGFDHLRPASLRLPEEAGLFNHTPMPLPPIRIYAPIESSRALRTGALEEESIRVKAKIPHQMIADAVTTKESKQQNNGGGGGGGDSSSGGSSSHHGSASAESDSRVTGSTTNGAGTEETGGVVASSLVDGGDSSSVSKVDEESTEESSTSRRRKSSCIALPASAKCWSDPCQAPRDELLLPNPSIRPFLLDNKYTEADPEYYLRPSKVTFDAPNTRRRRLIHGIGTSSLGSMEGVATLSSIYQETLERPFKSGLRHRDHEAVWSGAMVPPFLAGPDEDDMMSDTDSDEEEEVEDDVVWPTVKDSERAFREGTVADGTEEKNEQDNASQGSLAASQRSDRKRVVILARDRTQMLLGKRRAYARFPRSTAITTYLKEVDAAVRFPKNKLDF